MIGRMWSNLVGFGFRLLYNEMAFTYDMVSYAVSFGDWREWQLAALKFLPDTSDAAILEIAYGTGHLQLAMKQSGRRVVGYDLSTAMGRITQARLMKAQISATLVNGKAEQLPFVSDHFAVVVTTFPTNFIANPATLRDIRRVLVGQGRLVIVINGVLTGSGMLKRLIDGLYRITGQQGDGHLEAFCDRIAENGFLVTVHDVKSKHGYAQIIVAESTKTV